MKRKTLEQINAILRSDPTSFKGKTPEDLLQGAANAARNAQLAREDVEADMYAVRACAYLVRYLELDE